MSALLRGERGNALVEFALVMPILVLLLVGVLDLARAANAYTTLSSAAREGSHYAALHPTAAPSVIAARVRERVAPLDTGSVGVEASYDNGSGLVAWPSGGIPASSPAPATVPVRVRVTYPWSALTALVGDLVGASTFSATSTADAVR